MQIGWWTITLNFDQRLIYLPVVLLLVTLHFVTCVNQRFRELLSILSITTLGCGLDYLAIQLSLFQPLGSFYFFPLWLIGYWILFATSFSLSLNWLQNKGFLASLLVFFFAPLTYYAGERFGLLNFNPNEKWKALISYGGLWAFAYPFFFKIHNKILIR